MHRSWLAVAGLALMSSAAGAQGFDRSQMDTSCAPCRDFFRYANGGWVAKTTIPAAYPRWGMIFEVVEHTDSVLRTIVEDAARDTTAPVATRRQQIGTFYRTCMDSAAIEAAGLDPLRPELDSIASIKTVEDLSRVMGVLRGSGMPTALGFSGDQDPKHSARYIAIASQSGLGMPSRDYYLRGDSVSGRIRSAYVDYIGRVLAVAGASESEAAAGANHILALETTLAESSMTPAERRDPTATYHMMKLGEVAALTPHFSWPTFLQSAGASSVSAIDVQQPRFFAALDGLVSGTPLATWRTYLRWRVIATMAPNLSSPFVTANFRYRQQLTGVQEELPRTKRCLVLTSAELGEPLGKEYVQRVFTPAAKSRVRSMVDGLQAVLHDRIEHLNWMSPSTKRQALIKLAAFSKQLGYPDKWHDYSALAITKTALAGNIARVSRFEATRALHRIGMAVDRREWDVAPQTVDAFANGSENAIVFPAGILQPPWFDPDADDAVNYGGIGTVIGHEMTHLFDDQGRQYDANGNLRDWWAPADAANYRRRAQQVVDQFDAYTVVDSSTHVNGKLTLGENIADLGGLQIAYEALERSLGGKPRTRVEGFTPEQRFFLSFARIWRVVERPEFLKMQVNTDPHPPWMWRVNGPLSNMPEFARAFGCRADEPMVRPADRRAQIW